MDTSTRSLLSSNHSATATATPPLHDNNASADQQQYEESSFYTFLKIFFQSDGPPQLVILLFILSLAKGSTTSVIPKIAKDRYARLDFGYDGAYECSEIPDDSYTDDVYYYDDDYEPPECEDAADKAADMAAISSLLWNVFAFFSCPLVGTVSDARGRKQLMMLGIVLNVGHALILVLLQTCDAVNPTVFFIVRALPGLVYYFPVVLSSVADVLPAHHRTVAFGMISVSIGMGYAIAPSLAVPMSDLAVSYFSLGGILLVVVAGYYFIPETLPQEVGQALLSSRQQLQNEHDSDSSNYYGGFCFLLMRPLRDLAILNRTRLFRVLTVVNCLFGIVHSALITLLVYYVEDELDYTEEDVAFIYLIKGIVGIVIVGIALKPLNDCLGERRLILISLLLGVVHNIMFCVGKSRAVIFIGVTLYGITYLYFPAVGAIKSNHADETEQGRVQGALFASSSLAAAIGPVSFRLVENNSEMPGAMFLFGAALLLVGFGFALVLPKVLDSRSWFCNQNYHRRNESVAENRSGGYNGDCSNEGGNDDKGGYLSERLLSRIHVGESSTIT
mmetsp:Transcript_97/g.177  ORF Transcript_97/g.177 Transcript_97/m.177 type:complete len:560 (-) Transcript_97:1072-2751(-)